MDGMDGTGPERAHPWDRSWHCWRASWGVASPHESPAKGQALCYFQASQGQRRCPISKSSIYLPCCSQGHVRAGQINQLR